MNNLRNYLDEYTFNELSLMNDFLFKSHRLVEILFKDKTDKEGKPYIGHLLRVSSQMSTKKGKCLGLLHDVVEDIPGITFEDLLDFGIPKDVVDALMLVTKKESTKGLEKSERIRIYDAEIDNIINSGNPLAIELKYSDMSDNYNKERIAKLSPEMQEWFKAKYEHNLMKLEKKRKDMKND